MAKLMSERLVLTPGSGGADSRQIIVEFIERFHFKPVDSTGNQRHSQRQAELGLRLIKQALILSFEGQE